MNRKQRNWVFQENRDINNCSVFFLSLKIEIYFLLLVRSLCLFVLYINHPLPNSPRGEIGVSFPKDTHRAF